MAGNGYCRVCGVELSRPKGAYCELHRKNAKGTEKKEEVSGGDSPFETVSVTGASPEPYVPPDDKKPSKESIDGVLTFFVGLALSGVGALTSSWVTSPLLKAVHEFSDDLDEDLATIDKMRAASKMTDSENKNISKFASSLLAETGLADTAMVKFVAIHPEAIPAMMSAVSWGKRNLALRRDIVKLTAEIAKANKKNEPMPKASGVVEGKVYGIA